MSSAEERRAARRRAREEAAATEEDVGGASNEDDERARKREERRRARAGDTAPVVEDVTDSREERRRRRRQGGDEEAEPSVEEDTRRSRRSRDEVEEVSVPDTSAEDEAAARAEEERIRQEQEEQERAEAERRAQSVLIRDICCFLVSFKNSFRIVSIDRHGLCKHVFFTQQIIIDFALADLKKEEEEKAQHKKQVLAEIVEPLEDSYSLEDMTSCIHCKKKVLQSPSGIVKVICQTRKQPYLSHTCNFFDSPKQEYFEYFNNIMTVV
ncbi:hypothetical protein EB796_022766 [Bugula neritina]|uniref:Uncharacterized protein n=1 Tax=Bugula neritina TaxID=10212 RepID=A0A7J7IYR3_BUGNE|nr:hypothetical protein EB796_022766 [Bugula neritina]